MNAFGTTSSICQLDSGDVIRILSWNVHGDLVVKMLSPEFLELLLMFDIILIQETHLCPEEEETISVPKGFRFFARSRKTVEKWEHQHGGVCVFIRKEFKVSVSPLSSPDILVLDLGGLWIINAYILPASSNWSSWTDVSPEDKFLETVRLCSLTASTKKLLIGTDINARIGVETPGPNHLERDSCDEVVNAI